MESRHEEQIKTLFNTVSSLTERVAKIEEKLEDMIVIKNKVENMEKYEQVVINLDRNMTIMLEGIKHIKEKDEEQEKNIYEFRKELSDSMKAVSALVERQIAIDDKLTHKIERLEVSVDSRVDRLERDNEKFIHDTRDTMHQQTETWLGVISKYSPIIASLGMIGVVVAKILGVI